MTANEQMSSQEYVTLYAKGSQDIPAVMDADEYLAFISKRQKRSKYGNVKVELDGHTFASQFEARHYQLLRYRQDHAEISQLTLQPRFEISPAGVSNDGRKIRKTEYVADFSYKEDGVLVVVDTKGYKTTVYKLKKKLFQLRYKNIKFLEVTEK
jgi:hypothetical protein